jgi:hypothetical protein
LLAAKLAQAQQERGDLTVGATTSSAAVSVTQPLRYYLDKYLSDIRSTSFAGTAIEFWQQKQDSKSYSILPLVALDLVSAPATQAFVERLFSVCGLLTAGRRNKMEKSLNMRAWMKVNFDDLADMQI